MIPVEKEIVAKDLLTKSNLPASDYVINPYVGCPHACQYCYARFMKRFTGHVEHWGEFIDIKRSSKKIDCKKLLHKSVFLSSVTDCYNPYEEKYRCTREILNQLKKADCSITISTKSDLILRDIDILKELSDVTTAISINTLDEAFQKAMDAASSISKRIAALKELSAHGIHTVLFMSPIFPYITDFKAIIDETCSFVDEYWFENLNLRSNYKLTILAYISEHFPQYYAAYKQIYNDNCLDYWKQLSNEIDVYCTEKKVNYKNYFYHNLLVAQKKSKNQTQTTEQLSIE